MGRRASRMVKSGPSGMLVAAFSVALLALTLLLAVPARAQDTPGQAGEATIVVMRDQQFTKQTSETTAAAGQNQNTATSTQITSSSETAQVLQEGGQQAQADATEDDSRATTRAATDPAGETVRITESDTDTDDIVDRIVVPVAACEEDNNASVVVEDDDGTRVKLTDGGNVTIAADTDAITIVGRDDGGNLRGINASGGDDPQFGTEGETVDGEIVSSTGITCGREDPAATNNTADTDDATATTDDVTATTDDGDATVTTDDATVTTDDATADDARADNKLQGLSCAELLVLFRSESGGQYGDAASFADSEVRAQIEVCLEQEIVKGTAADGDLPDTGGLSLLGLAVLGVVSAAAGLAVIRGGRR